MTLQHKPGTGARGIEWTDRTINATGGCLHGCRWRMPDGSVAVCYAETVAERVARDAYPQGFAHHYWRPHVLEALKAGQEPELRFVDSMADLFGHWVPEDQVRAVLGAMREAPHHAFQVLTKAPPQILKYVDELPPNLWVGISTPPDFFMGRELSQAQKEAMLRRGIEVLAEVRYRSRCLTWLSAEPVSWDIGDVLYDVLPGADRLPLDWCVVGAASNGRTLYQPHWEHVSMLLDMLDVHWVPAFFKGNIRPLIDRGALGRWREDLPMLDRLGQPIPAVERRQARCVEFGWALSSRTEEVGANE